MPSDGPDDSEIGYKKPPIATRFKKGNNANLRRRPRGSKMLAELLQQALDEPVAAENGKRRRQTQREVVIRRLVEKSAGADLAATKLLFELLRQADPNAVAADPANAAPLGQDAVALLKERLARLARANDLPRPAGPAGAARLPADAGQSNPTAAADPANPRPADPDPQ